MRDLLYKQTQRSRHGTSPQVLNNFELEDVCDIDTVVCSAVIMYYRVLVDRLVMCSHKNGDAARGQRFFYREWDIATARVVLGVSKKS